MGQIWNKSSNILVVSADSEKKSGLASDSHKWWIIEIGWSWVTTPKCNPKPVLGDLANSSDSKTLVPIRSGGTSQYQVQTRKSWRVSKYFSMTSDPSLVKKTMRTLWNAPKKKSKNDALNHLRISVSVWKRSNLGNSLHFGLLISLKAQGLGTFHLGSGARKKLR